MFHSFSVSRPILRIRIEHGRLPSLPLRFYACRQNVVAPHAASDCNMIHNCKSIEIIDNSELCMYIYKNATDNVIQEITQQYINRHYTYAPCFLWKTLCTYYDAPPHEAATSNFVITCMPANCTELKSFG